MGSDGTICTDRSRPIFSSPPPSAIAPRTASEGLDAACAMAKAPTPEAEDAAAWPTAAPNLTAANFAAKCAPRVGPTGVEGGVHAPSPSAAASGSLSEDAPDSSIRMGGGPESSESLRDGLPDPDSDASFRRTAEDDTPGGRGCRGGEGSGEFACRGEKNGPPDPTATSGGDPGPSSGEAAPSAPVAIPLGPTAEGDPGGLGFT